MCNLMPRNNSARNQIFPVWQWHFKGFNKVFEKKIKMKKIFLEYSWGFHSLFYCSMFLSPVCGIWGLETQRSIRVCFPSLHEKNPSCNNVSGIQKQIPFRWAGRYDPQVTNWSAYLQHGVCSADNSWPKHVHD